MRWLQLWIVLYLLALVVFYMLAIFDTRVWDFVYFSWSKLADGSVLAWACVYKLSAKQARKILAPIVVFSVIRFLFDIQSFFTGLSVNGSPVISISFAVLALSMLIISCVEGRKI